MADQLVLGPACARLCAEYDVVCAQRFEGKSVDELEATADRLIRKYPPV